LLLVPATVKCASATSRTCDQRTGSPARTSSSSDAGNGLHQNKLPAASYNIAWHGTEAHVDYEARRNIRTTLHCMGPRIAAEAHRQGETYVRHCTAWVLRLALQLLPGRPSQTQAVALPPCRHLWYHFVVLRVRFASPCPCHVLTMLLSCSCPAAQQGHHHAISCQHHDMILPCSCPAAQQGHDPPH